VTDGKKEKRRLTDATEGIRFCFKFRFFAYSNVFDTTEELIVLYIISVALIIYFDKVTTNNNNKVYIYILIFEFSNLVLLI